ncbi:HSP20 family protein [Vigna unguiculata]|uniref:HSP20 family protein n=1 Tax=Vigna unguiculata TaxID=3917 RepID=A0A4D6MMY1_VIGUN|nr:HSP20 family protein [Vigna unguiculata]
MAQSTATFDYQDFDPYFEWSEDEGSATLIVMLPGFTKEQLRVQVTSAPMLRINGERQILENKRRRFSREFSIPPYCDTNDVSAKFEGGVLTIKFPKLITLARAQPQIAPISQKEKEQDHAEKQESVQKEKEPTSDEKEEKKTEGAEENEEKSDEKEKGEMKEEEEVPKEIAEKKVRTNVAELTAQDQKPKAKITQRLKTRVLDFTVSLRSVEDQDVKQGFGGNKYVNLIKRPKILMNIGVVMLLVIVLGLYVKNAFKSSSSSQGGTDFEKFKEF